MFLSTRPSGGRVLRNEVANQSSLPGVVPVSTLKILYPGKPLSQANCDGWSLYIGHPGQEVMKRKFKKIFKKLSLLFQRAVLKNQMSICQNSKNKRWARQTGFILFLPNNSLLYVI